MTTDSRLELVRRARAVLLAGLDDAVAMAREHDEMARPLNEERDRAEREAHDRLQEKCGAAERARADKDKTPAERNAAERECNRAIDHWVDVKNGTKP